MKRNTLPVRVAVACLVLLAHGAGARAEILKIAGSSVVNKVVSDAAQILRAELDMEIQISTQGSSSGGIGALGTGDCVIAMSSRPLNAEDRAQFPDVRFTEIPIGAQVVAFAVAADVWESGVKALGRDHLRALYEGRVQNWKELGGADQKIVFYNWEEGAGVWEIFTEWIYGDNRRAPLGRFATVSTHEEARNSVEFTRGGIAPVSPLWIDERSVFPLGLKSGSDSITPTIENIATRTYPMARPLFLLVNDKPTGAVKTFVDFLLSERGQGLFRKHGYHSINELKAGK